MVQLSPVVLQYVDTNLPSFILTIHRVPLVIMILVSTATQTPSATTSH